MLDIVANHGASLPILLADDFGTMRKVIKNLLKQIGFTNVEEVDNGHAALEKLRERKFGLIISDWNMEPMSGLELLKAIRADEKLSLVPFMMVTGEAKSEKVLAAREAGVTTYMIKPFTAETLRGKLALIL